MSGLNSFLGPIRLASNYILADFNRRKRNYIIGIFAVFVVASFATLLGSVSHISSLFLINIAENSVGDYDFLMYPSSDSLNSRHHSMFLNFTDMKAKLSSIPSIRGITPRLYSPVIVYNSEDRSLHASGLAVFEDSHIENEIGIGRRQNFEELGRDEIVATQSLIDTLKPKDGKLTLQFSIVDALVEILAKVYPENQVWELRSTLKPSNLAQSLLRPLRQTIAKYFPQSKINTGVLKTRVDEVLTAVKVGLLFNANPLDITSQFITFNLTEQVTKIRTQNSFLTPVIQNLILQFFQSLTLQDVHDLLQAVSTALETYKETDDIDLYQLCYDSLYEILKTNDIEIEAKVKQSIVSPMGKWPNVNGHAIAIDYQYLPYYLLQHLRKNIEKPRTLLPPPDFNNSQSQPGQKNDTNSSNSSSTNPNPTPRRPLASVLPLVEAVLSSGKISEMLERGLNGTDHYEYALILAVVLKDKLDTYNQYQTMFQKLSMITDKIYRAVGMEYPISIESVLYESIISVKDIPMFTDVIFLAINFLLNLLCAVLIYSLLNSDIQEKTFEFGTLRSMGLDRNGLLSLMLVRATFILIPGLILGHLASYVIYTQICFVVFNALSLTASFTPPPSIIFMTTLWSVTLVLLASALPIMRVLARSLAQSINVMQRSINEIIVVVKRLEDVGMSSSQIIGSLLLTVFGFSMYYLAPSAFLSKDFSGFLNTMASLLLLTIFAMIIMLGFLQTQMQSVLIFLLNLCWRDLRLISKIIKKNFISHRPQNFRTANMIGIAFGFMIFGIASFTNLGNIFTSFLRAYNAGSDLSVLSSPGDSFLLPEKEVREFFANYTQEFPDHIKNYTMTSNALDRLGMFFGETDIVPLNGLKELKFVGWAVEQNFLAGTFSDYYLPGEVDPAVTYSQISSDINLPNPVDALYSDEGLDGHLAWDSENITSGELAETNKEQLEEENQVNSQFVRLMISPDLIKKAGLHIGSIGRLSIGGYNRWWFKVRAIPKGLPWYRFTENRLQPGDNPVALLSMEDFGRVQREFFEIMQKPKNETKERETWSYGVPKKYLFVKFARDLSDSEIQTLRNRLLELVKSDSMKLVVTKEFVQTSEDAIFFFSIFTVIVGLLGLFLAFFVSWNSAWSNIRSNETDIGILRAVGVTQSQLIVIFIVENLCVALIGSFNGTLVGIMASVAFTAEASIFTYTPMVLRFPAHVVGVMALVTLGLTALASKLAIEDILMKQITQSFRKEVAETRESPVQTEEYHAVATNSSD